MTSYEIITPYFDLKIPELCPGIFRLNRDYWSVWTSTTEPISGSIT